MLVDNAVIIAGDVKITAVADTSIAVYIPNKDNVIVNLPKDNVLTITTVDPSETLFYAMQADKNITIELPKAVESEPPVGPGPKETTEDEKDKQ